MKKSISILLVTALLFGLVGFLPASAETYTKEQLSITWFDKNYSRMSSFLEGLASVEYNGKTGFINTDGKEVIPYIYDSASLFWNGYATVSKGGKALIIDKSGKEISLGNYDDISYVTKNLFSASTYDGGIQTTLLDIDRNIIVAPGKYSSFYYARENRIYTIKFEGEHFEDDTFGLITEKGEELMPCTYNYMSIYSDGLIAVGNKEGNKIKYGYADKNGKFIIEPQFYYQGEPEPFLGHFRNGKAVAMDKDNNVFVIDKTGKKLEGVTPESLNKLDDFDLNYLERWQDKKSGKYGYKTKKHGIIIPAIFDEASYFVDDIASIKMGNKWGILKDPRINKNEKVTALVSPQKLTVNNVAVKNLEVYNIGGHNYFKLRDIAKLASSTESKFSVTWNGEEKLISLVKGEKYKELGTELKPGDNKNKKGIKSTAKLKINGESVELNAYNIEDQNYYEIRPLGEALGFEVDYNSATKTVELTM